MRIVQLSTYFHPSVGGVERQVEEIAYGLANAGHQVEVITTDATHGKEKRMQRLNDSYRGLKVIRYPYWIRMGNFWRFSPGVISQLLTKDYDLLHIHNVHDGHLIPAIVISKLRRKLVVVTGHNPFVVDAQKRGELLNWIVKLYDRILAFFLRKIDAYIALLESEKAYLIASFGVEERRIRVVPNGIQDIYYQAGGSAQKFYQEWEIDRTKWQLVVGAACRVNYVKGLQNLLKAVRELPQVLFIFAGGDDGYLAQIRKLFLQFPNVIITGSYLASEEMQDFYSAIDAFLLPSIYEPFGMTVVEAMAQGKYIIASNKGGTVEIVKPEFGVLIDPLDQQMWQDQIAKLMREPELAAAAVDRAKHAADNYRWEKIIPRIEQVYRAISSV